VSTDADDWDAEIADILDRWAMIEDQWRADTAARLGQPSSAGLDRIPPVEPPATHGGTAESAGRDVADPPGAVLDHGGWGVIGILWILAAITLTGFAIYLVVTP
jgi:hypothetical protein